MTPIEALTSGRLAWAVLSGKMTSGKDTLAGRLELPGRDRPVVASYGDLLRADLDLVMPAVRAHSAGALTNRRASASVAATLGIEPEHADILVDMVAADISRDPELTPHSRTDAMRFVLQALGSTWREHEGPNYLAERNISRVKDILASGRSVISAGSRFIPDADIPRSVGAFSIRLDVSPETQKRRLMSRDGLLTDDTLAAMAHPGESDLDDYPHDIRVSNDSDAPGTLDAVVAEVNAAVADLLAARARAFPYA